MSMQSRRAVLALCAAAALTAPAARAEAAPQPFSQQAFDQAVETGRPILVHVATGWCPICKAQKPILAKLLAEPRFREFAAFAIDFDADKPSARALGAQHQSTLIVFKSGKEIARSVGESQPEWIEDLLEKAL